MRSQMGLIVCRATITACSFQFIKTILDPFHGDRLEQDIRREALGRRLDAERTRTLLDGLDRAGWLKLVTTKTDGRAIHRWQVNPLLFSVAPEPERSERSERGSLS